MEIARERNMKEFDTTKMPAVVETNTFSGSAFAVNSQGEQIFINSRIMERMKLREGMQVNAYVLPNYEDKRDTIPWRAMRVDTTHSDIAEPRDELSETDREIMRILWDKEEIGRLWTDKEIAEKVNAEAVTTLDTASSFDCHRSCVRLHDRGFICRVDFSSDPKPIRSTILWTADIRDFED